MKPLATRKNNFYPYLLLFIQPIFMASNIIVARGGVEYVPPISLAFWRWLTVFIILIPFFLNEIIINHMILYRIYIGNIYHYVDIFFFGLH